MGHITRGEFVTARLKMNYPALCIINRNPARGSRTALVTNDFERDELAQHGVTFDEAVECFFSDCQIRRNKKYRDRHQLLGRALGGRKLKIIFQLKPRNVVRIITG